MRCLVCNGTRWRRYRSDQGPRIQPCPECVSEVVHEAWMRRWPDGNPSPAQLREAEKRGAH